MLKSVGVLTIANGVNAVLAFTVTAIAARSLSTSDFGVLSVLATTSVFLALSLDFGMNQVLTARLALRRRSRLASDILGLRVGGAVLVTAGAGLALLGRRLLGAEPSWGTAGSWALVAASTAWQVVFSTEQAVLQARQMYRGLALLIVAVNGTRLVLVAGAAATGADFSLVFAAYMVPSILAGVLIASRRRAWFGLGRPRRLLRSLVPVIALAGVTVTLSSMLGRIGIWAVSALDGSAAAGTYAVALQAASLVLTFGSAMTLSFLPQIAQLDRAGSIHAFLGTYTRRAIPVLAVLLVGAAAFAQLVPLIFGGRYAGTSAITFLLMTSYIVSTFNSPFYLLQQTRLRYAFLVKVHAAQAVALALACLVLVPRMGPVGAAVAEVAMRVATVWYFVTRVMAETRREAWSASAR